MDTFSWWTELTHHGILISAPVLKEKFEEIKINSDDWKYKRLRDHYNNFLTREDKHKSGTHPIYEWIDYLFEKFLEFDSNRLIKGNEIPDKYNVLSKSGLHLKPKRILVNKDSAPVLLIQTDTSPRLGMHRGRRSYSQFLELLRKTNVSLGILTNGHQIRLVYAGLDHDAWTQWQVDSWFEEGELRTQLDGFLTLLSPSAFKKKEDTYFLLDSIELSRERQADLATVLGDQIRQAVEILTSSLGQARQRDTTLFDIIQINPKTNSILTEKDVLNAVYQAATRMVMRLVFLFYAEAKNLLPKDNHFYESGYGIEGLYSQLSEAFQHLGQSELESRFYAWPRFLGLCTMIHDGSEHEFAPIKAYGGRLFRKGDSQSQDPISRALTLFENTKLINDYAIYSILRLIKIGKTKVKQGQSFTWVSGPVDFTQLRTEYIGMMYEGLLDYELKMVEKGSPKIILNLGKQPILPLTLLDPMDDKSIKNLIDKLKNEKDTSQSIDEESGINEGLQEEEDEDEIEPESEEGKEKSDNTHYQRAIDWAIRAVEAGRLIKQPRKKEGLLFRQYEENKLLKAKSLLVDVLEPGDMYLVRWGGNRKGTGTFYTKPALAVPTTQRTLEPLVYDSVNEEKKIKTPKEILDLNVCDPSVGSGTFLVAAARYLTEALFESLLTHVLKDRDSNGNVKNIPNQIKMSAGISFQPPPLKSSEEGWEDQIKARLKRLVVEHCLYGVDINGMAVELTRLALWLETMDKDLPFEFLDHRIKVGNSLVGTWFCHFLNYPAKAWERQDGTGNAKRNKKILREKIKPELIRIISSPGQYELFEPKESTEIIFDRQLKYWDELDKTPLFDTEKREEIYSEKIEDDPEFNNLKHQFNRWTAVWFWPTENEDNPIISPLNFFSDDEKIKDIVRGLKWDHKFFHWELEFPEVFSISGKEGQTGFDAIVGNPPWDIQKPNSKEFFSNFDPIYRTYGKQEALRRQKSMFQESSDIEGQWIQYNAVFKALSNYVRNLNEPYDISLTRKKDNEALKRLWRLKRSKQPSKHCESTPYSLQGSADINLYKLFLEQSRHLLKDGGNLGMIIPSGIYTDKGSTDLRKEFLEKSEWEWLYGFENRKKVFDIHRSFKFGPLIVKKGGKTQAVKCAFMRHDLSDWEDQNPEYIEVTIDKIKRFSPDTLSFMELKSDMDLKICEKIYSDRPLLGNQVEGGWNVKFATEFHMTNDSHLFTSRNKLEKMGILKPDDDVRDPRVQVKLWQNNFSCIIEGKNIHQYTNTWAEPSTMVSLKNIDSYYSRGERNINQFISKKVIIRQIAASTNMRTSISSLLDENSTTAFSTRVIYLEETNLGICIPALFNSFVIDWLLRLTGNMNLTTTLLNVPVPCKYEYLEKLIKKKVEYLFGELFEYSNSCDPKLRLKYKIEIDCIIAELFSLSVIEFGRILENFPLVDKDLNEKNRQTNLTLRAFRSLKKIGMEYFIKNGLNFIDDIEDFIRPGIKVWIPKGGWQQAWKEAKEMLSAKEWQEFIGEDKSESNQIKEDKSDYKTKDQLKLEID
jgi:hypothetical protein